MWVNPKNMLSERGQIQKDSHPIIPFTGCSRKGTKDTMCQGNQGTGGRRGDWLHKAMRGLWGGHINILHLLWGGGYTTANIWQNSLSDAPSKDEFHFI